MTLPSVDTIDGYTCYLRARPFGNPVAVIDNELHLFYACENVMTGATTSWDVTVPFTPDMISEIRAHLINKVHMEA